MEVKKIEKTDIAGAEVMSAAEMNDIHFESGHHSEVSK